MRIGWTRLALTDLIHSRDYIAAESPTSAGHVVDRIEKSSQVLGQHPEMGRQGRVGGTRELIISGTPFILAYRIKENKIEILSVIHSSRKWPEAI
jgi:addiction module RelE/StbE family toxin